MPPRNPNTTSVTRPLHGARINSKALSRSAKLKASSAENRDTLIPNPAKPARGNNNSAHIVSFAEAKRTNGSSKSLRALNPNSMAAHNRNGNNNSPIIRGKHASLDFGNNASPLKAAHASQDLTDQRQIAAQKPAKSSKKKFKMPEMPFGRKRDKEFVIPSGEDLTTDSSRVFQTEYEPASEEISKAPGKKAFAALSKLGKKSVEQFEESKSQAFSRTRKPDAQRNNIKAAENVRTPDNAAEPNESAKKRLTGFFENRRERAADKKHQKTKAKANKKFDKTYGGAGNVAAAEQAGPRAALYSTKMGTNHKKSAKMQIKDARDMATHSVGLIGEKLSNFKLPEIPKYASRLLVTFGVIAIFAFGLYAPAQQYYVQMRETDRLQAEFIEVANRTNNLADSIDSLHTKEGIEDKAHKDLGYVKSGEKSATVKGIAEINLRGLPTSNVAPGSIPAPDTWYSGALDVIFGYTG